MCNHARASGERVCKFGGVAAQQYNTGRVIGRTTTLSNLSRIERERERGEPMCRLSELRANVVVSILYSDKNCGYTP